jgi:hypothetical protein
MKQENMSQVAELWLESIKKEIFEDSKQKEVKYNFNFENEEKKTGRFVWSTCEMNVKDTVDTVIE